MDLTTIINLIINAVIVYACFRYINDVLKEKQIINAIGKTYNYIIRAAFGMMIAFAQYNVIYFHGATFIQLAGDSLVAILLFLNYHFHHRYIFPLIPDETK